jgi:hypothetical protein
MIVTVGESRCRMRIQNYHEYRDKYRDNCKLLYYITSVSPQQITWNWCKANSLNVVYIKYHIHHFYNCWFTVFDFQYTNYGDFLVYQWSLLFNCPSLQAVLILVLPSGTQWLRFTSYLNCDVINYRFALQQVVPVFFINHRTWLVNIFTSLTRHGC